ncbi:retinol dehydrogenase 13 [Leptinotarsa decemlineata]|uniref:retinol dehydrogenase 13 n=1 Tax=Leptinotarsa decemlineata TaxID=7539 RepID=UPI000C252D55|nr:retinol dehydrogenase 13-like [Leptinotarsa decemlineata]
MMRFFSARCNSVARLDGKTAVITGANTGIGKCTAKDFFERGARVILACRNEGKGQQALTDIQESCGGRENVGYLKLMHLDLSSLKSVRAFAAKVIDSENKIDLLINNAGVMMCPESRTEDGFEMQFGTNHLGHFLLTLLLLPKICQSVPARIVNVSSVAHCVPSSIDLSDLNWNSRPYSAIGAYQQSKLANVLFTKELARKLKENNIENVTVYSLHPGIIKTELGRHLRLRWLWSIVGKFLLKNPEQGAQTQIYCAVDENCASESGLYYSDCKVAQPSTLARNEEIAKKLWDESLKLVGFEEIYCFQELKSISIGSNF